jgi:pimeloyl-ACP methyl ester carboxylesterase
MTFRAIARASLIVVNTSLIMQLTAWAAQPPERQVNSGLDLKSAVALSREYLEADDDDERQRLRSRLSGYSGEINAVVRELSLRNNSPVDAGYHAEEKFRDARRLKKYPNDLLYFVVPKTYDPKRPTGLIVFMHGGGKNTSRDAPMYTLRYPLSDSPSSTYRSGDMLEATEMITVGPSAPFKFESYYRWCLRGSEDYLLEVIQECKERFNIDPDRVFLLGHSMGGFGAFHHALRQPDRFTAIISCAGSWDFGYWPVIRGTPISFMNGVRDAQKGVRWHHTDVEYGRWTHRIFTRENLDHDYLEYDGDHDFSEMRPLVAQYLAKTKTLRRDPYYPHVTLASPQGFASTYLNPVRHNRWVTMNQRAEGNLEYDELVEKGEAFDEWRLEHRRVTRSGAMIDAINRGYNRIDVSTENVTQLTVWLHPRMIDVAKPVTIVVDGRVRFQGQLKPSLVTALESYERRLDWGMIYPMKVMIESK